MAPERVAARDAAVLGQGRPQRRRLAEAAGAQLEADQRGERLLGRAARGPAAAEGLGEADHVGQPVAGGAVDDVADPALDEGERGLQPGQGGPLLRACPRA